MQRLLEDFDAIVHMDRSLGRDTLGAALASLLDGAEGQPAEPWTPSEFSSSIASLRRECMHYYYRPHAHPGLDEKLLLAHQLQFRLLPTSCPANAPVNLATVLESYSQISGDLMGWRFLPDESFLIWVLDISGHGLKAGLLSAVLKTIVDRLEDIDSLETFVRQLNVRFLDALKEPGDLYYATGIFVRLYNDRRMEYISAAHPQAFMKDRSGAITPLHSTAVPVGLYADGEFGVEYRTLAPNTMLLLYTDGVTEAANPQGELFGINRVKKVLGMEYQYPDEIATGLYRALSRFQAFDAIQDDVTFLTARVK